MFSRWHLTLCYNVVCLVCRELTLCNEHIKTADQWIIRPIQQYGDW